MTRNLFRNTLFVFAAASFAGGAVAQPPQEITVEAPRIEMTQVGRPSIARVLELTLTQRVGCEDLDLSTHTGMAELERRVRMAAQEACEEIARKYPRARPSDLMCAGHATREAMVEVRELLAAN